MPPLGDLYQVGVVVRDIDKGMARYTKLLGLGPFWRLDTDYDGRYRDWRGRFANRNAFTRWGNLYLEMIEPVQGQGNAKEWLETRGEGIFHMGYAVDDLTQRPEGAECVFESWGVTLENGDPAVIHLDTVAQLGYFVELSDRALVDRLNARIDSFIAGLAVAQPGFPSASSSS
jgi:methylmalonyl-CoA/ethylmalonyl-CoA epimerase